MGRPKRTCPLGKYRLRAFKSADKGNTFSIELEYTWNGSIIRKATGIVCREEDWNPKGDNGRGELRPGFGKEYKHRNQQLKNRVDKIDALLADYHEQHPNQITRDIIVGFLDDKPLARKDMGKDFYEFTTELLRAEYERNRIGKSTYENGMSYMGMFTEFLLSKELGTYKPDGIYVAELTPKLIDSYIEWRRNVKRNGDATINHALTPILKASKYACDLGLIEMPINARIQDMRVVVKPSVEQDAEPAFDEKYLTEQQLAKLKQYYETCKEPRRKQYLEIFLFAFYACGLRIVDVMTLQWGHINFEKKELSKIQIKTTKRHVIPLRQEAIDILLKWREEFPNRKYVFGLCDENRSLDDTEKLYYVRNNVTRCINQSLNVVGEKLDFPISLTMHIARHSFAVFALNHGCSMSVVSRLLGHGSTDITEKIYAKFLPETLANEVGRLDMGFLK